MTGSVIVVGLYAVLCAVGGVVGFVKAGSRASLIAGVGSGAGLAVCVVGLAHQQGWAAAGSLLIAALLGGRFAMAWRRHRRLFPDGVMVLMSLLTLLAVGRGFLH